MIRCRYSSRALVVPFSKPSIGPKTEGDNQAFSLLTAAQQQAASAIGWVIGLGKSFEEDSGPNKYIPNYLLPAVREALPEVDPRLCTGYACLLFFAEKVIDMCAIYY